MQLNGQIVVFSITIFNDVLGMLIMVLTGGENMELSEIIEMLQQEYPEKIVVDLTEYENEDHQTYKFLYEQLDVTHTQKMNEFGLVISDMQQFTKENAELEEQNRTLKEQLDKMNSSVWQLLDQFKNQVNREIVVSDVKTSRKFDQKIDAKSFMQTISTTPGIYGGKRPSWYTPLKRQLSRENMKRKNVSNTIGTLKNKLLFWKNMKTQSPDKAAAEYDNKRRDNILKLLQEECSNEEKYLKYFLLTPGLDREYLKTLQGAAQINVDANLVIALLEQPNDSYNREIIELYVSEIHKGTEYDLKQELAEELIRGEWCINAKVEGKETVFQLVPIDELNAVKEILCKISDYIDSEANGEVCANLAQIKKRGFMERFSITINSTDIDLFERYRSELGLTKSAFIRYLIAEHKNGVPDFLAFKEVIKQMAELNTYMKEFIINENFETNDKLLLFEKINTLMGVLKSAIDDCAKLAQSSKTDRNKK